MPWITFVTFSVRVRASIPLPTTNASARVMPMTVSGLRSSTSRPSCLSPNQVTMPIPARHAASTESTAAPGYRPLPVSSATAPREYL